MKCAICGKEFGNGYNCRNCGADKVSAFGSYCGYDRNQVKPSQDRNNSRVEMVEPLQQSMIVCWHCSEPIPANCKFCPNCGTKLNVECPNCGTQYNGRYSFCPECGTNREIFFEEQELARKRELEKARERETISKSALELRTESDFLSQYRNDQYATKSVVDYKQLIKGKKRESEGDQLRSTFWEKKEQERKVQEMKEKARDEERWNCPDTVQHKKEVEEFVRKAYEERLKDNHIRREKEREEERSNCSKSAQSSSEVEEFVRKAYEERLKDNRIRREKYGK